MKSRFHFYQFLEHYCERFEENNPDFDTKGHGDFYAVIDGQQRLTSLYLGLKGTYAYKLPRKWWPSTKDDSILPLRRLYLNLSAPRADENNEEMMAYEFRFLTDGELKATASKGDKCWFLVGDILDFDEAETDDEILDIVMDYLQTKELEQSKYARKTLTRLYFAVRRDHTIHYYNESNQSIDRVLDIFIRTNHGGTPLAFSDLLMSIAVANWKKDAREQIDDVVDTVRFGSGLEFSINRDFVLKTCLMLTDADIQFKVKNFNHQTVQKIEQEWDGIKKCIIETFKLIRLLGLNDRSLRAKNAVIPIAYYLFKQCNGKLYQSINNLAYHHPERVIIGKWLNMSLLRRVFGGQSDTVLRKIRNIISKHLQTKTFPLVQIVDEYKGTNKDISFDEDFIDRLLTTQKEDSSCFLILALIMPDLDYSRSMDIDHLHPAVSFRKDKLDKYDFLVDSDLRSFYEDSENWNGIANLHLLDSSLNKSKNAEALSSWLTNGNHALDKGKLLIPENTNLELSEFKTFIESRKVEIKSRLCNLVMKEN